MRHTRRRASFPPLKGPVLAFHSFGIRSSQLHAAARLLDSASPRVLNVFFFFFKVYFYITNPFLICTHTLPLGTLP